MIPQFEPLILASDAADVHSQVMSGWVGAGQKVTEFEDAFRAYVERKHAIAVPSGTAALMISFWAFNLKPNDKICIPNYSFPAAFQTTRLQGFQPILVDINPSTMCMSYAAFKKTLEEHSDIKAVVWIPHNGYIDPEFALIQGECRCRGIHFIEDSACGLGCKNNYDIKAGTIGSISTFSFSVPKVITTGQGGMIVTDNDYLVDKCREIVDQGSLTWRKDGIHAHVGANFKFNDILASLGLSQLKRIEDILKLRADIMRKYLVNGVKLCSIQNLSSPWMMVIQTKNAHRIQIELETIGYQSRMMYKPAHYSFNPENKEFPGAEQAYQETLYLPSSLNLTKDQIDEISKIVLKHY